MATKYEAASSYHEKAHHLPPPYDSPPSSGAFVRVTSTASKPSPLERMITLSESAAAQEERIKAMEAVKAFLDEQAKANAAARIAGKNWWNGFLGDPVRRLELDWAYFRRVCNARDDSAVCVSLEEDLGVLGTNSSDEVDWADIALVSGAS